jgi:hypothetical protein
MVARAAQNKLMQLLPYVFSVATFLLGFYLSYLSFSMKVDVLTTQLAALTNAINTQASKQENSGAQYNSLDKRVSILELKNELKPAQVSVSNEQKQ